MTRKTPAPHIAYILDTLKVIKDNTPKDKVRFLADPNAQDATLMRLQDIGEQAQPSARAVPGLL